MTAFFEELDSESSPIGEISLRRRRIPALGDRDIYEVKLGDEFLLSSAFIEGEIALAEIALEAVAGDNLKVVVGGLGLGYTAQAVLNCDRVGELTVVELLDTVIDWHQKEIAPLGKALNADPRCQYVSGNFFELAVDQYRGFRPDHPRELVDAILLDIDHSPRALLDEGNGSFYSTQSLALMARHLRRDGVFAMWSNESEDKAFMAELENVFRSVESREVAFDNPFHNGKSSNTVYLARL